MADGDDCGTILTTHVSGKHDVPPPKTANLSRAKETLVPAFATGRAVTTAANVQVPKEIGWLVLYNNWMNALSNSPKHANSSFSTSVATDWKPWDTTQGPRVERLQPLSIAFLSRWLHTMIEVSLKTRRHFWGTRPLTLKATGVVEACRRKMAPELHCFSLPLQA
eukprot:909507-Amphidinium_carterae.4